MKIRSHLKMQLFPETCLSKVPRCEEHEYTLDLWIQTQAGAFIFHAALRTLGIVTVPVDSWSHIPLSPELLRFRISKSFGEMG